MSDGKQLWASTFDERSTDPFFLEDALAEQTAQALVPHLAKEPAIRGAYIAGVCKMDLRSRLVRG